MRWLFRWLLVLGLIALATGCAVFRKKRKPQPQVAITEAVVGAVDLVNTEQNFVLIHNPDRRTWPVGTELVAETVDGMEVAKLKVSPERMGTFLTADIVSGNPEKGQIVMWHKQEPLAAGAARSESPTASISPSGTSSFVVPQLPEAVPSVSTSPGSPTASVGAP
ncbi:MAG: hypothetical protein JNJ83_19590 [Verrucomicrobiaceae bacterium]|nr:hypothetical protein [Verrucomicrobiaceae bacterium]